MKTFCETCYKVLGPDELVYELKRTKEAGGWPFSSKDLFVTSSNDWPASWAHFNCWNPKGLRSKNDLGNYERRDHGN